MNGSAARKARPARAPQDAAAVVKTRRTGERPLGRVLLLMVLAPVVPLLLCAMAVWYQWRSESDRVHEALSQAANAIAVAVDREIERSKAMLDTLAASELIDAKDWRAFHRLASQAVAAEDDAFIALTEPSGLQPVRTMVAYGAAPAVNPFAYAQANAEIDWNGRRLPLSTQGLAKQVFAAGRMANSGLYYGVTVRKPVVSIAVPVIRGERVAYVLIKAISRRYAAEQSEHATRRLMAALAESESRFRTFFEHSGVGIGAVDAATGRFLLVNRKHCEITGYAEAELLERSFSDVTHPEDRDRDFAALRDIASGACDAYEAVERYVRKDGALRWVELHARRIRAAGDDRAMTFASIIDITGRKEAQLALIAADRRKDEFLATLAHELRNPLAPLRSGLEILKRHPETAPALAPVRALMERQVKHMVRLIDDLLDVSRITTGQLQLQQAPIDLADVLDAAAEACRPAAEAAGHRLTVEVGARPVTVHGDSTRLFQAIDNLVTNAIKYSDQPGEITLRARAEDGRAIVTVRDTGIGIPPDKLELIFDLFSQVHGSRGSSKDRGLGIGLHLVKRLVELHGGSVTAHSRGEGAGSEFRGLIRAAAHPGRGRQPRRGAVDVGAARRLRP